MQKTMEDSAGIYRTAATLEQAAAKMRELQDRFHNLRLDDRSYTFNTELLAALELGFMLDVADTIIASALARRESRGSHQRTDFPQRDDQNYLTHSLASRPEGSGDTGAPRISYLPVTITRWPPAARTYGK